MWNYVTSMFLYMYHAIQSTMELVYTLNWELEVPDIFWYVLIHCTSLRSCDWRPHGRQLILSCNCHPQPCWENFKLIQIRVWSRFAPEFSSPKVSVGIILDVYSKWAPSFCNLMQVLLVFVHIEPLSLPLQLNSIGEIKKNRMHLLYYRTYLLFHGHCK